MSLFDSSNAAYVQALYEDFARNPEAVPDEWRSFFAQGADVAPIPKPHQPAPLQYTRLWRDAWPGRAWLEIS